RVSVTAGSPRESAAASAAPSSSGSATAAGGSGDAGGAGGASSEMSGGAKMDIASDTSSGMISGRSIVGSSSAVSEGVPNIPPSYCVCASPSTTKSWGLSSTSSCTSIPSALAALCATAL